MSILFHGLMVCVYLLIPAALCYGAYRALRGKR